MTTLKMAVVASDAETQREHSHQSEYPASEGTPGIVYVKSFIMLPLADRVASGINCFSGPSRVMCTTPSRRDVRCEQRHGEQ